MSIDQYTTPWPAVRAAATICQSVLDFQNDDFGAFEPVGDIDDEDTAGAATALATLLLAVADRKTSFGDSAEVVAWLRGLVEPWGGDAE
jgi:hypothetical protein